MVFSRPQVRSTREGINAAEGNVPMAKLTDTLQLVYADCSCPAGAPLSTCKHVGVMCYGVEEFCRHGVFKGVTSCTSQLQRWNAPPAYRAVEDMSFARLEFGKFKAGSTRDDYDSRPAEMRKMDAKVESRRLRESLVGVDKLTGCAFLRLLTPLEDYGRLCVPGTSQAMTTIVETVKEMIQHVMQKNTPCRPGKGHSGRILSTDVEHARHFTNTAKRY